MATRTRFDVLCLLLGWLWPGLGYIWLGQRRRGVLIMSSILAMIFIGVLVGGVHVVDRREEGYWFLPQVLAGPVVLFIDYLNATFVTTGRIGTPSIGRVHEIGMLYIALAGLMNLAAMIDGATRPLRDAPPPRRSERPVRPDDPALPERRAAPRPGDAVESTQPAPIDTGEAPP